MELRVPQFGEGIESGTILRWNKKAGEQVLKGETICEIEVDKAIQTIEAERDCVVVSIRVPAGEMVEVGTIVAVLDTRDPL